jgi:hypothetical protein
MRSSGTSEVAVVKSVVWLAQELRQERAVNDILRKRLTGVIDVLTGETPRRKVVSRNGHANGNGAGVGYGNGPVLVGKYSSSVVRGGKKVCARCRKVKAATIGTFGVNRGHTKTGLQSWCRPCQKAYYTTEAR